MYNDESRGRAGSIEQKQIHPMDQAFFSLDPEGLHPSSTSRAQSAPAAVIPHVESLPQVCKHIGQVVAVEVAQEYTKQSQ